MVRIGILLTLPKQEQRKGELLGDIKGEWTNHVPKKWNFDKNDNDEYGKYGIPTDVAIGAYAQHGLNEKDVEVDFIPPKEISKKRLASNDLNFLLIYDVLEAFHTDKSTDKETYNNLKKCLLGAKNVYPPREYQEFVYSKINYYKYLQQKKVNVLPTFTMTTEEYKKIGHEAALKKLINFWDQENLGDVIAKPVYGQEGIDVDWFDGEDDYDDLGKGKGDIPKYFKKCARKYPGFVVQQMVKGFGHTKASPELRMYYMGNRYQYSVCAGQGRTYANGVTKFSMKHPKAEGGTLDAPLSKLKAETKKILKKLPPIVMPNGARLPRLITRIDMGYRVDGKYRPFVNEVEFVPSLYAEYKPLKHEIQSYVSACAKQMVKITKLYVHGLRKSGKPLLRTIRKSVSPSRKSTSPSRSRSSAALNRVQKSHLKKSQNAGCH